MSSINKVILIGHLGADPELKYTPSGSAVCDLRLATSESYQGKDGKQQERTDWHRVTVWGKQAEAAAKYLGKGSLCYVEGRLQTRSWDDKDGKKQYITEVVAKEVVFLSRKEAKSGVQPARQQPPQRDDSAEDDIPF
jgi:single-strand DNA-binding protein